VSLVGQLWRNVFGVFEGYPQFTQPGGPGTVALPQQAINELNGMFRAGCGHSFNSWLILTQSDPVQGVVKLVCCPVCTYVQNQYTLDAFNQQDFIFG
jgi:hypothetical protein